MSKESIRYLVFAGAVVGVSVLATGCPGGGPPPPVTNESEPNNTSAAADGPVGQGTPIAGNITADDVDFFRVTLSAVRADRTGPAGSIAAFTSAPAECDEIDDLAGVDTELILFDTNGTTILKASDDTNSDVAEVDSQCSALGLADLPDGTYFIEAEGYTGGTIPNRDLEVREGKLLVVRGGFDTGTYELVIFYGANTAVAESEPNNSSATAQALTSGNAVTGTLESNACRRNSDACRRAVDEDFYKVTLGAPGSIVAFTTSTITSPDRDRCGGESNEGTVADTEIVLLDGDGTTALRANDNMLTSPDFTEHCSAVGALNLPAGMYFIKVVGHYSDTGDYKLVVFHD